MDKAPDRMLPARYKPMGNSTGRLDILSQSKLADMACMVLEDMALDMVLGKVLVHMASDILLVDKVVRSHCQLHMQIALTAHSTPSL